MTAPKPETPLVDAAAERGSDLGAANEWASGIWPLARRLEQDRARLIEALKEAMENIEIEYCSHGSVHSEHEPRCYTRQYYALLRELGELE